MSYTPGNNLESTDADLNNIDANKFVETVSDGVDENLKDNFDSDSATPQNSESNFSIQDINI